MSCIMKKEFDKLSKLCGNHSKAAEALGFSVRQYRRLRNQNSEIPKPTQNLIKKTLLILEIKADHDCL